jgi:CubicO group peptidase (beta-lactamase class C family)
MVHGTHSSRRHLLQEGIARKIIFFMALLILAGSGSSSGQSRKGGEYVYRVPESLDDGWTVSSFEAEGIDTDAIARVTQGIMDGRFEGIHSMLIVKNGRLVHEAYFGGYTGDSLHKLYSITKSVTSALIGIAIDKKLIRGVDEAFVSLVPEYAHAVKDAKLKQISLEDILTLTSGLEWDEKSYYCCDPRNSEGQQMRTEDWVRYIFERPVRDEPGTRWIYNTGSVHALSAVIKSRSGLHAGEFAEKYLFEPLGIERYEWNEDPKGYPCTGGTLGGLRLRTRDLAKFGMLFLRDGRWKDTQVISKEWVETSTTHHVTPVQNRGFGYLWWRGSFTIKNEKLDFFYAAGYGGQSLQLVPELDLMIVFTCHGKERDADIFAPTIMILGAAVEG